MQMTHKTTAQAAVVSLLTLGTLMAASPAAATNQSENRQNARETRQDTRQHARQDKADCRAADQKSNVECRGDKRAAKQDGREKARDIKY